MKNFSPDKEYFIEFVVRKDVFRKTFTVSGASAPELIKKFETKYSEKVKSEENLETYYMINEKIKR